MNNDEFIAFLKRVLIKIENAINLMNHTPPRHIPVYNKMLGVCQKLEGLDKTRKDELALQIITAKSIINYFINGSYDDGTKRIIELKRDLVKICLEKENEKNTVRKPQETRG